MKKRAEVDYIPPKKYTPPVIPKFEPKFNSFTGIVTEYDECFCERIINHAEEGGSPETFAAKEYIDPDSMIEWCNDHPKFKAAVKIAMAAEYLYWEQYCKFARDNIGLLKDMLPTINRKLTMLETTLAKNGLRKSMYGYEEPDPIDKDQKADEDAMKEMENL